MRQGKSVDVFSFGLVLFYCLTGGRHAFGESYERDFNIMQVPPLPSAGMTPCAANRPARAGCSALRAERPAPLLCNNSLTVATLHRCYCGCCPPICAAGHSPTP